MMAFDPFLLDQVGQNRFAIERHENHLLITYHGLFRAAEAITEQKLFTTK